MTRELKLALIVGFSLVLVVTVLISDHLSRARKATLDGTVAQQPQQTPKPTAPPTQFAEGIREPEKKLAGGPLQSEPIRTEPQVPEYGGWESGLAGKTSDAAGEPPIEIKQSRSAGGELEQFIRNVGGDVRDGVITLPPAADVDANTRGSSTAAETPGGGTPNTPHGEGQRKPIYDAPLNTPPMPSGREYQIAPGDSLYKIAKREYGNGDLWRKLAQHNAGRVNPSGEVRVGARIMLPSRAELASGSPSADPAPRQADATPRKLEQSKNPPVIGKPTPLPGSAKTRVYTIKKGDTLGSIAMRELGTTKRANEILELNKNVIRNPNAVPLGVTIKLPA